ncbi:MAG: hypothetical protein K6G10_06540, partial [Butyrivibrio sp.]|nr:hypothetical protein [Butyrivibrio sp.]
KMDVMNIAYGCIEFAKDKIDRVVDFWDDLEPEKKKLFIGCACAAIAIILVAAVAYGIGRSAARKELMEDEDF